MILRGDDLRFARVTGSATRMQADVGRANGLTRFGAHVVRLEPGEASSDRHWHALEDEFMVVLEGRATVIEDDGPHELGPGDMAVWPAGVENAHHVRNTGEAPVVFLVLGDEHPQDRVRYPDSRRTLIHGPDGERMIPDDGDGGD